VKALTPTDSLLERLHLIPDELVERNQWIVWRNESGRKTPYNANAPAHRAKVNNPKTWAPFSVAVETFAEADNFTGIGYVFDADDPYIGVDLDDCVSGDDIHPDAKRIIDSLGGYGEISPSGTGIKVWTRGKLDIESTGRKTRMAWGGDLEVYHKGRWFAVTGWRLD